MIKRTNSILILSILILSLTFCVDVNTATRDLVPRNVDIDRSNIPKNILVGSYIGGMSHVRPMLDITAILAERGYNVRIFFKLSSNFPIFPFLTLLFLTRSFIHFRYI